MADDEEPLDHLLDDPDLEHFLKEIVGEGYVHIFINLISIFIIKSIYLFNC
jgi:hypothetical protein